MAKGAGKERALHNAEIELLRKQNNAEVRTIRRINRETEKENKALARKVKRLENQVEHYESEEGVPSLQWVGVIVGSMVIGYWSGSQIQRVAGNRIGTAINLGLAALGLFIFLRALQRRRVLWVIVGLSMLMQAGAPIQQWAQESDLVPGQWDNNLAARIAAWMASRNTEDAGE